MTATILSGLIQTSVKSTITFLAPFMELPPDERTFAHFIKKSIAEKLHRWLAEQNIDFETNPWKIELGSQTHKIQEVHFKRPFIKIFQGFWEKGWLFLKINTAPSKINLLKFDLNRLNQQLEGGDQKFQVVGMLFANLPKNGVPICNLSLKTPGERFYLDANTLSELLNDNHFMKFVAPLGEESINEFDYNGKLPNESEKSEKSKKGEFLKKRGTLKEKIEYLVMVSTWKFLSGRPYPNLRDLGRFTVNYLLSMDFNLSRYDLSSNDENWDVGIDHDSEIKLSSGEIIPEHYLPIYRFANKKNSNGGRTDQRKKLVATVRWRLLFQDSWEHVNSVFPLLNSDLESSRVMGACALIFSWP
ncbi:MAG: hypothetical protein ACTSYS_16705, partial [Promethearchaeota archaeon]